MQAYGDDFYIQNDFIYARKYAPANCKFYLNDFNENMPAKTQKYLKYGNEIKRFRSY